jgi:hypothetical protein
MSSFMQTMLAIQKATVGAKSRTGDQTLGTRVDKGRLQVVRVIKHTKGPGCDVLPVTEFLPIPDAIAYLESMQ